MSVTPQPPLPPFPGTSGLSHVLLSLHLCQNIHLLILSGDLFFFPFGEKQAEEANVMSQQAIPGKSWETGIHSELVFHSTIIFPHPKLLFSPRGHFLELLRSL